MGRTDPTYRDLVSGTEERWAPYRRALRRADEEHFDRLFEHARAHADAGGYLNHRTVEISILVSVALEHQKQLAEFEQQLAGFEQRLAGFEQRLAALESDGLRPSE